jgi:peptidyl-prolyl cis-trans isomerase C
VRTSHILIAVPAGSTKEQDAAAKQRADALLARVRKGEDFAKLARENSMDSSASTGGDIGFTEKGQLDSAYENAAWSLATGQASGVIRSGFGYHIIKVNEKKKAGTSTLEESREQLTNFLKQQKRTAELDKLVNALRAKAQISVQQSPVGKL